MKPLINFPTQMKYLPFENITYKTKLSSSEIIKRLNEVTEPRKLFRISDIFRSNNHKPYEGLIEANYFTISRIIRYRNSFLPKISGRIESEFTGTVITVKMRLNTFVLIFMSIWFTGVGLACFAVLAMALNGDSFSAFALIPFGMLLFGYAISTGGFKHESLKSKYYFAKLFEASIEE